MSKRKQSRRPKHIPQRTCVACRQKRDKRCLTRIVRTPDDGVVIDPSGKRSGRGAYLCDQPSCWDKIINSHLLAHALKTEISEDELVALNKQRPILTLT